MRSLWLAVYLLRASYAYLGPLMGVRSVCDDAKRLIKLDMWMRSLWLTVYLLRASYAYLGPLMGVRSVCDDAKTNLRVDWDERDFSQFTCFEDHPWMKSDDFEPIHLTIPGLDPTKDIVWHKCMNETIFYNDWPPVRGDHRPNWAVYGEYLFLPPQRWLHNLEHGAIVMLYHPCADSDEVDKLRRIVRACLYRHIITPYNLLQPQRHGAIVMLYHPCADADEVDKLRRIVRACLYRHIITPYNLLQPQRPIALVAWGSKLLMNKVDELLVVNFIK
uniref:DUF3105 domain-containing protein n=1 Tax=Ascaris lumbricoides TaxID=6252 RepID=A0A0M3I582_ASCLU